MPTKTINQWRAGEVAAFKKTCCSDAVFNVDEDGIFYQLKHRKTLTWKQMHWRKKCKATYYRTFLM